MHANIGLVEKNRRQIVNTLNVLLADEYMLYTKTRNYRWNVVGAHFNDPHKFGERLRDDLTMAADLQDAATSDFMTGLMERHEKTAWMLRACLES